LKRSFSLIELIFTIVIISLVFTVIPKIIYVTNMSINFSIKENGIFNMMSHIMDISLKEWDENNTADATYSDDILLTGNLNILECNIKSGYRVGGFIGSRNCKNDMNISAIGLDDGESDSSNYDDIDDYNATEENASEENYEGRYKLYDFVIYTKEWNDSNYNYDTQSLDFNFSDKFVKKSNIKYVNVVLKDGRSDKNVSLVRYWSANIGHMYIESRQW
jgi:hypothetical protein